MSIVRYLSATPATHGYMEFGHCTRMGLANEGIDAAKFADSKIDGPALHELWLQRNEPAGQAAWNQLLGDAELAVSFGFAHRLRGVSRVALAPAPPPPPPPYPSPPPSPFAPVPAGPKTGGIIGALLVEPRRMLRVVRLVSARVVCVLGETRSSLTLQ